MDDARANEGAAGDSLGGFLALFSTLWRGGHFEGDPLDPMGRSGYQLQGYLSSLYATYLCCIKPFVGSDTVAIEIGPGRGGWTKAIAAGNPKHIYAVDVASPEHTGFWTYVGRRPNVDYIVAHDFSLDGIPDATATYAFSFGTFCHLRPEMCDAYFRALARKMRGGGHGFIAIADFDKFNRGSYNADDVSIERALLVGKRYLLVRAAFAVTKWLLPSRFREPVLDARAEPPAIENAPAGLQYHLGTERACAMLRDAGFDIVDRDMGVNHRDPLIHFAKPATP
jgi:hypothetical protein